MGRESNKRSPAMLGWPRPEAPADRLLFVQHNYRAYFLKCIERQAPEIVKSLVDTTLALYMESFHAEAGQSQQWNNLAFEKRTRHHPEMARVLFDQSAAQMPWNGYVRVRLLLESWVQSYALNTPWVAREALDALLQWTLRAPVICDGRQIEWPIKPIFPRSLEPTENRAFKYRMYAKAAYSWLSPDDLAEFRRETLRAFQLQFDAELELEAVERPSPEFITLKAVTKPERFAWLVLYQCLGHSFEHIGSRFHRDSSVVQRDVTECARLIEIPLRSARGRRKPPTQ